MTLILKLTKGAASLDLNDQTNYRVALGFTPPAVQISPILAGGGSANRYDGAKLIDQKANSRPFNFRLHIIGDSEAAVSAKAERVAAMLALAGDDDEPLYLEYRPSTAISTEPVWGQAGANRRYKIITGQGPTAGVFSGPANLRAKAIKDMQVSLTLAPYALGIPQRLCTASGGVIEDVLGAADGVSRGLVAPEATTNLFSNPIFTNATYTTAWTVGSALVASQITNPAKCYPGAASAVRLVSTDSSNNTLTQSLTLPATSHTISFWTRRIDGVAVAAGVCQITYNGSGQSSTYTHVGNNIYRVSATVTGTAGAAATGLLVSAEATLEVLGAQCEAKAYATPLACGDFLGHSWSGTAHAASSTSARVAGSVKLPISEIDNVSAGAGCIRVVWRPHVANTHANDQYIFDARDGSNTAAPYAYFKASDDKIYFAYGGNTASSSALTFSAYSVMVLHFVWGANSDMSIYIGGAEAGNSGAFNTATMGANLFIGSDYSSTATLQCLGTLLDFTIWQIETTTAEVLADYQNVYPEANAARRVGCIPWLHTKDGDNIVDNCIDASGSTGAPHENFATISGIPGSVAAETVFKVDPASNVSKIYLSNWAIPFFLPPLNTLYFEQSGTAGAVTDSTANYLQTSVSTTGVNIASSGTTWESRQKIMLIAGRQFYMATRLNDAGTTLSLSLAFLPNGTVSGGETISTDYQTPSGVSGLYIDLVLTPPLVIPPASHFMPLNNVGPEDPNFQLYGKRTTGTANVQVDYICLMPSPLMSFSAHTFGNIVQGRKVTSLTTAGNVAFIRQISGDVVELEPGKFNVLLSVLNNGGSSTSVQQTLEYTMVQVAPRYMLF